MDQIGVFPIGATGIKNAADGPSLWATSVAKNDKPRMVRKKMPHADLHRQYGDVLRLGIVLSLLFLILMFQLARKWQISSQAATTVDVKIEVADVPVTEQFHRPPPPPKPSIPIPSDDDAIPEDLTIESTNIDLSDIPPPPAPPEAESHFFVAYDEPPVIIGGLAALSRKLVYPPLARKSGVEGSVFAKVLVNEQGRTVEVEILQVSPTGMFFERSATEALLAIRWKPARQRDRQIKTWITVPVKFRLTE